MLTKTLTIASTESESDVYDSPNVLVRSEFETFGIAKIVCPTDVRGMTSLTLEESWDSGLTWKTVKDSTGTAITITIAANASIALSPALMSVLAPKTRLKGNAAATGGDASFVIAIRPF